MGNSACGGRAEEAISPEADRLQETNTAIYFSLPWAYDVIENELEELNLLGCSIGTYDLTFRKLREEWGTWEALALIGLLKTKMQYPSIELLAQDAHLHPNSIGRHIQKKFVRRGFPRP